MTIDDVGYRTSSVLMCCDGVTRAVPNPFDPTVPCREYTLDVDNYPDHVRNSDAHHVFMVHTSMDECNNQNKLAGAHIRCLSEAYDFPPLFASLLNQSLSKRAMWPTTMTCCVVDGSFKSVEFLRRCFFSSYVYESANETHAAALGAEMDTLEQKALATFKRSHDEQKDWTLFQKGTNGFDERTKYRILLKHALKEVQTQEKTYPLLSRIRHTQRSDNPCGGKNIIVVYDPNTYCCLSEELMEEIVCLQLTAELWAGKSATCISWVPDSALFDLTPTYTLHNHVTHHFSAPLGLLNCKCENEPEEDWSPPPFDDDINNVKCSVRVGQLNTRNKRVRLDHPPLPCSSMPLTWNNVAGRWNRTVGALLPMSHVVNAAAIVGGLPLVRSNVLSSGFAAVGLVNLLDHYYSCCTKLGERLETDDLDRGAQLATMMEEFLLCSLNVFHHKLTVNVPIPDIIGPHFWTNLSLIMLDQYPASLVSTGVVDPIQQNAHAKPTHTLMLNSEGRLFKSTPYRKFCGTFGRREELMHYKNNLV